MGSDWDLEDVIFDWVKNHRLLNITYEQINDLAMVIHANYNLEKKKDKEPEV